MNILMNAWSYFATNILQQPAWMIGLIVLLGYILLRKPWYDVLGGTIKAVVGYMILAAGSGEQGCCRGARQSGGFTLCGVFRKGFLHRSGGVG